MEVLVIADVHRLRQGKMTGYVEGRREVGGGVVRIGVEQ